MLLLSILASEKLQIEGRGINNDRLYGDLDIRILMEQSAGSTQKEVKPGYVCKLLKSFCGTKQAGEIWDHIRSIVLNHGDSEFQRLQ